jgi:imidazolonepropionase-like amidohydrolase
MTNKTTRLRAGLAGLTSLLVLAAPAGAQTVAITGGTVYPVSGPKLERATIVIKDGKITEIGPNVSVPAGATTIDAAGKWITPGLIHAQANAGTGVAQLFGYRENRVQGDVNPSFNLLAGVDPAAISIPLARTGGVTTGMLTPSGGLISGQAVAVDFAGERLEDLSVKSPAAMLLDLSDESKDTGGGSRAGVIARLRRILTDAIDAAKRKGSTPSTGTAAATTTPSYDLEALAPVIAGEEPLYVRANRRMDIENALRLANEFKLKLVIAGGVEAWQMASELAAARVPVALAPNKDIPDFDGLGARLDNATLLRAAGVTVLIAQEDPGGERNLRFAAGNAVRNGMTWDDALKAVTLWPAQAFGLSDRGSLEPGKVANLVIWSGDPFDFSSAAEKVLIRGRETSLRTRETELLERYRTLPARY